MKAFLAGILVAFSIVTTLAQSPIFKAGDRVCFVGNSITNNGDFYHNILTYYVTRFPDQPVTFFNCGISGDVCSGVLKRMDDDILIHKPTYAVIKLGMNDVNRGLYTIYPTTNADTLAKREEAIAIYKIRLDSIVNIFLKKGIKVILQKPTIYDQTAAIKRENNFGVNDALKSCADYIQSLADKYNLPVVDYWSILNNINNELQKKNDTATIIGPDRVHPGPAGHLIMAYQFLKTTNAPQYVSEIVIDKDAKTSNMESKNCTITKYIIEKNGVNLKIKENALPFPASERQKQGLELVPFINDLAVEKLVIKNAAKRNQLLIDNALIGVFSADELASGINLSLYTTTPQYLQAQKVREALDKMWKAVADLRTIEFVEFKVVNDYKGNKDIAALKEYFDVLMKTKFATNTYYKPQLEKYLVVKPNQAKLWQDFDNYREDAYKAAQPIEHSFAIEAIN
ncbi:SGNH/GDSL hydrolase family protein [Parasediminibacterium sp. JCM 36343]|uniref:SGNH/GDSL hydrolase family protein n=1 Tax=Parasediminibacterium sp. JCM 36343 TaxID=3374279 RepID=UPI00397AC7E1